MAMGQDPISLAETHEHCTNINIFWITMQAASESGRESHAQYGIETTKLELNR